MRRLAGVVVFFSVIASAHARERLPSALAFDSRIERARAAQADAQRHARTRTLAGAVLIGFGSATFAAAITGAALIVHAGAVALPLMLGGLSAIAGTFLTLDSHWVRRAPR